MANDILFSTDARNKLAKGIRTLRDAVKVTLGPKGRNVIIEQDFGVPLIVNDGVTIAKNIELKDHFEKLGSDLIVEAASKTNDTQGDGTTTAIVLSSNLILEGLKNIEKGVNGVDLRSGFDYYLPKIVEMIKSYSKDIKSDDDILRIATISSGSEKIGKLILDAYKAVGPLGEITVEDSRGLDNSLDVVLGYSYDRGYASSYLTNDENHTVADLKEKPLVLVTDKKITSMKELLPFLEAAMNSGKALLIICDDIEQEVLSQLVYNKLRGAFNVVVTRAPSFGDRKIALLKDIACLTGATFISSTKGETLQGRGQEILGTAESIHVESNKTIIVGAEIAKNNVESYITYLQGVLENTESKYEQDKLKERLAKLASGIAVIRVGAINDVELNEKKLRIEDALCATRAAIAGGTVEGAGKVFYTISEKLTGDHYLEALVIIKKVLKCPVYQILENSGIDKSVLSHLEDGTWVDAENSKVCNLREAGIIDPTNVLISAITNALKIAGIVLTTECAIVQEKTESVNEDNLE